MFGRIALIARQDFAGYLRRPMVWIWILLMILLFWGLASGHVNVSTGGDSAIGGKKQWITSEFEFARIQTAVNMILTGFFASVLFGMAVIHDADAGILPLLASTRLRTAEYLVGKFLGCALLVGSALALNVLIPIAFYHGLPPPARAEYFGPLEWWNYIGPMVKLTIPTVALIGATAFAIGALTRKAILVFVLPTMLLLVFGLFLNSWSPIWLDVRLNRLLNWLDPFGSRWLNEVYFNVDRGADFYNIQPVHLDAGFGWSRVVLLLIAVGVLAYTIRRFGRQLRGAKHGSLAAGESVARSSIRNNRPASEPLGGWRALAMQQRSTTWLRDVWNIARYELRELRSSPGLYLFVPIIVLQGIGTAFLQEGAFGTPLLATPGILAEQNLPLLSILGCLLMMFYTVESQLRERTKRLAPIYYATQAKTAAILLGKSFANVAIGGVLAVAVLLGCLVVIAIQSQVALDLRPFLWMWGLVLLPTYIVWTALMTCVVVWTRNRYTAYAIGAAVLVATFYLELSRKMFWVFNWNAQGLVKWSDLSVLELDRGALWLNRFLMLAVAALFVYLATQFFWRRSRDAVQIASRRTWQSGLRFALRTAPFVLVPLLLGGVLWVQVSRGTQGSQSRKADLDYWRKNVETWKGVPSPAVSGVDVRVELVPEERRLAAAGWIRLRNETDQPLKQFALSQGRHWRDVQWKFDGQPLSEEAASRKIPGSVELPNYTPVNRAGLHVFSLKPPLAPGDSILVHYAFRGQFPDGITKNGGGASEFVLPSGVVLTSFGTGFFPFLGFNDQVGLDEKHKPESKVYDADFYRGCLLPAFGGGDQFHVRTTVVGPADMYFNGVGQLASDTTTGRVRTMVYESDAPVSFFNIVGGRWQVRATEHTQVYYSNLHPYNVDEIAEALEEARFWYSRWFAPYPWRDLKLSEFPGLASYAQGFATNITFSESIGFLTRDEPGADLPFMVAAHEAAHQWWGNLLMPGKGPSGDILSEGMAHFSTGLLFDQVKGTAARIAFFEKIEKRYAEMRSLDSERPMVEIDGTREGDTTVTYDRGGWVFWMLLNEMGRDNCLHGLQSFIAKYRQTPDDYPVLQDLVEHLRPFAADPQSYDAFVGQWIFGKVVPEFRLRDVQLRREGEQWLVEGQVQNVGSGAVTLELLAGRGERFRDGQPDPEFRQARTTVYLGDEQPVSFSIPCDFEPEFVRADPDALILQLKRNLAVTRF